MVNGYGQCQQSMSDGFRLVSTAIASYRERFKFAFDQLFAQRIDMVDEHLTVKVVKLMLHDSGQIALYPFVMLLKRFIHPLHANTCWTLHFFMDRWQRQTTLFRGVRMLFVILNNMRINKRPSEPFILRHIFREQIKVDHRQSDSLSYLRGSQTNAF